MRSRQRMIAPALSALALCFVFLPPRAASQQLAGADASGQDQQLCAVSGTVVAADTGEPLKKARVFLWTQGQEKNSRFAASDAAGRFSFDQIQPGRYILSVTRTGYVAQQYGQDQPDKPGAVLTLAAGQKMTDLLFRLLRTAVISGRVLDEDGEPIPEARIELLSRVRSRKQTVTETVGQGTTNDLGEYRVFNLAPGHYSVRASPSAESLVFAVGFPADQASDQSSTYAPIYYPGTPDVARAATLDVNAGDEISGIDFLFTPKADTRTYKIRGRVVNSIIGHPDAHISVMLLPASDWTPGHTMTEPDFKTGAFELKGVAPGAYTVGAWWFDGSRQRAATQDVDVTGADVDGVSLVLTNGINIPGHVSFEGHAGSAAGQVTINLTPANPQVTFGGWEDAHVQMDGSFVLSNVGDGQYSIEAYSKCDDCYLKSATGDGVDILKGFQVASGAGPSRIDILYSSDTGTADGSVTTNDGLPAPGAYVVLVPDSSGSDAEEQKSAETDQYGRFEVRGIPPGKYTAYAWEKMDDNRDYGDPDFLKPFADQSQSVDVSAGAKSFVQLKLIPAIATNPQN